MSSFVDRCIFVPSSGGTGTWTVASAVPGYLTPAGSGALNATLYSYAAETRDAGNNILAWEIGTGTYTVSGTTLTRTPVLSSNANAVVSFATPPHVMLCVLSGDMININAATVTTTGNILPSVDNGPNIGSSMLEWANVFIARFGGVYWDSTGATLGPFMDGFQPGTFELGNDGLTAEYPQLFVESTTNDATGSHISLVKGHGGVLTPVQVNDVLGTVDFVGANTSGASRNAGAAIYGKVTAVGASSVEASVFYNTIGTTGSQNLQLNGVTKLQITPASSIVLGSAAIAANATDGFLYIPTCAGPPTGVPTAQTGRVPMIYDTTNHQFWFYDSGWKQPKTPAGAAIITWQ